MPQAQSVTAHTVRVTWYERTERALRDALSPTSDLILLATARAERLTERLDSLQELKRPAGATMPLLELLQLSELVVVKLVLLVDGLQDVGAFVC